MGPRTRVLETEGTTPKFLYAIIRQMDLKTIDWNRLAQQLEISNGHAARMRFARFRRQMDGPSPPKASKKKMQKKIGKELPRPCAASSNASFDGMIKPVVLKPEPTDDLPPLNPIKSEQNGPDSCTTSMFDPFTFPERSQWLPMSSFPLPMPQYSSYKIPFAAREAQHPLSMSAAHSLGHPNYGIPQDTAIQDFGYFNYGFNAAPLIGWEDQVTPLMHPNQGQQTPLNAPYVKVGNTQGGQRKGPEAGSTPSWERPSAAAPVPHGSSQVQVVKIESESENEREAEHDVHSKRESL